jgi:ribosome-associated protein
VNKLKEAILKSLDSDKGQNIEVIDLSGHSALADYIIIVSGTSSRHITSMADKLCERLDAFGTGDIRIEGKAQADWVVVDAGDIIIHLFRPEVREFYNIEKMWQVENKDTGKKTPKTRGLK